MRRGRLRLALWGAAVVALYVAGAILSSHISPFARRPLFDGTGPPKPYRWVRPPPALAPTNQDPESGSYTLTVSPKSQPGVFQTNDRQAVLILPQGAIPPSPGATSVSLTLTPLAPTAVGSPPAGLAVAGNVYVVRGKYEPGGKPVTRLLTGQSEAALVYPLTNSTRHVVLRSADGKAWAKLPSTDSLANHQVLATKVNSIGYFAVGVPASGFSPQPNSSSSGGVGGAVTGIIAALAAVVLLLAVRAEFVRRRNAREERSVRDRPRHRR